MRRQQQQRVAGLLTILWLVAGCTTTPDSGSSTAGTPDGRYAQVQSLEPSAEWRFYPLVIDVNRDGFLDLVTTARLQKNGLFMWLGDGKGNLTPVTAKWRDPGYAALAAGDINGDGFPDMVGASHFNRIHTLLSDGKGGYTDKVLQTPDAWTGAALVDVNGDGKLDLVVLGFVRAGVEVYLGDGTGDWKLHAKLPERRPSPSMVGQDLVVADLNGDGHPDILASFQMWGAYIFYNDGKGNFSGEPVSLVDKTRPFRTIAVGDLNKDGYPDIVITTAASKPPAEKDGPDVFLGDGRGGWKASNSGLKALKLASVGVTLGDLDRDGNIDIVAGGNVTGELKDRFGIFWFRGDGKGNWRLVTKSGLPDRGLGFPEGVRLADFDGDGFPEIITTDAHARLGIWKRQ